MTSHDVWATLLVSRPTLAGLVIAGACSNAEPANDPESSGLPTICAPEHVIGLGVKDPKHGSGQVFLDKLTPGELVGEFESCPGHQALCGFLTYETYHGACDDKLHWLEVIAAEAATLTEFSASCGVPAVDCLNNSLPILLRETDRFSRSGAPLVRVCTLGGGQSQGIVLKFRTSFADAVHRLELKPKAERTPEFLHYSCKFFP